ncbi:MAG TPA: glutathione S-transferase family protein [Nannocystis sp.]
MQLELISFSLCPFVHRAAIMLREKGVAFTRKDIDLKNKPEWFLAISPRGKVPVLVADGVALFESAAICEFLDETHPPRLIAEDPFKRARQRAWVEVASDLLFANYRQMTAPTREDSEAAAKSVAGALDRLEEAVGRGEFGPGSFGYVDVATAPALYRFVALDELTGERSLSRWPKVEAWARALAERASVRTTVPEDFAQQLLESYAGSGGWLARELKARAQGRTSA